MIPSLAARWLERAGWIVCGLSVAFAIGAFTSKPVGHDLVYYVDAAAALVDGRSPYRGPTDLCEAPFGCFPYPPPVLLLFVPLVGSPIATAAVGIAAAYAVLAAAVGAVLVAPLPRVIRPWAATAVALYFPLLLELNLLNLNLVTLALALTAFALRRRPFLSGPILAGAVGVKVLGAPLLLFYGAAGLWRTLAWAAATLAAIALVTAPWVGPYWADFLPAVIWRSTTDDVLGIRPGPLRGAAAYAAVAVASAAVIVAAGVAARRSGRDATPHHAVALAAIPFLAHLIQYPALVLALPLIVALVRAFAPRPPLLALPALAWLAIQMPIGMEAWRFGGLLALVAMGAAVFLPRALRGAPDAGG